MGKRVGRIGAVKVEPDSVMIQVRFKTQDHDLNHVLNHT
jgi:hypothetical protein